MSGFAAEAVATAKEEESEDMHSDDTAHIECVFCSLTFPSHTTLQDHFELLHDVLDPASENREEKETPPSDPAHIKCFLCPFQFDTFEMAGKHYIFEHKLFHLVRKAKKDTKRRNKENVENAAVDRNSSNNIEDMMQHTKVLGRQEVRLEKEKQQPPNVVGYQCALCAFNAATAADVVAHLRATHAAKPISDQSASMTQYKCQDCSFMSLNANDAKAHWKATHQKLPLTPTRSVLPPQKRDKRKQDLRVTTKSNCQLCEFSSISIDVMNEHLVNRHMFISCTECSYLCPDVKSLADHTLSEHTAEDQVQQQQLSNKLSISQVVGNFNPCNLLDDDDDDRSIFQSNNITANKSIVKSSSSSKKTVSQQHLRCNTCGFRFYSRQGLRIHAKIAHKMKEENDDMPEGHQGDAAQGVVQPIKQKIEGKVRGPYKRRLTGDIAASLVRELEKCGICKLTFTSVREHFKLQHTEERQNLDPVRPRQCKVCKEYYPSLSTMKDHYAQEHRTEFMKELEGEPEEMHSFKALPRILKICRICSELHHTERQLFQHFKDKHPGQYPAKCNECDKAFSCQNRLQDHMVIHKPDYTPFQCELCLKQLKTRRSLKRHTRLLHQEGALPPKSCDLCNKTFRWPLALKRHRLAVHSTTTFQCDQCPSKFKAIVYLNEHIALIHSGKRSRLQKKIVQQESGELNLCYLCGFIASTSYSLEGHLKNHEMGKKVRGPRIKPPKATRQPRAKEGFRQYDLRPLPCGVENCGKRFRKEFWRARHWRKDHGVGDWVRKKDRGGGGASGSHVAMKQEETSEEEDSDC